MLNNTISKILPRLRCFSNPGINNVVARCSSSSSGEETKVPSPGTTLSENDVVNPEFRNRNPRNLEFLGLAKKSKGWKFQYPMKEFYHRLVFQNTSAHTTALVEHCTGEVVVSASTKELCIARHLYSNRDVSAARNIGRVIALRCLQAGIVNMILKEPDLGQNSKRFEKFREAVEEGGVDLFETEEVQVPYKPGERYLPPRGGSGNTRLIPLQLWFHFPDHDPNVGKLALDLLEAGLDYDNEEEMRDLYDRQLRVYSLSHDHRIIKQLRKIRNRPGSVTRVPKKPISLDNANHRIQPF